MKTNKILQVMLVIAATCLFASCAGGSSSQQQKESFWEGQVQPGTYKGSWRVPSAGGENAVKGTLTIYDDETVKYKEEEQILWGDYKTYIEVSTGYIYKHVETYNGERKDWYGIETKPEPGSKYSHSMNLSTSLQFSPGNCRTYQEYSFRIGKYGYLRKQ